MQEQLNDLQTTIDTLSNALAPLVNGHPILMIQNADDIAQFNIGGDNKGIGSWEGWAICDGGSYPNATGTTNITTPNLLDRFVVGALGTYAVDDTGGSDTVALTAAQNGTHTHTVTQNPHTHNITDPGHSHGVTDPTHTHAGSSDPHTHTGTTASSGTHNHDLNNSSTIVNDANGGFFLDGVAGAAEVDTGATIANDGAHTHTFTTDATTSTVNVTAAATGISIQDAFIGITETESENADITINNSGTGDPHENRPPYYALIFVMKIF
jgi:microcystin-dependent protein